MIYLYLFGTCFHFIYVFMIIVNNIEATLIHEIPLRLYAQTANLQSSGRVPPDGCYPRDNGSNG